MATDQTTNGVTFWDREGVAILHVVGEDIDSDTLVDLFDNNFNRARILARTGRVVDNTSEEFLRVEEDN
jgi:hypothetical protein